MITFHLKLLHQSSACITSSASHYTPFPHLQYTSYTNQQFINIPKIPLLSKKTPSTITDSTFSSIIQTRYFPFRPSMRTQSSPLFLKIHPPVEIFLETRRSDFLTALGVHKLTVRPFERRSKTELLCASPKIPPSATPPSVSFAYLSARSPFPPIFHGVSYKVATRGVSTVCFAESIKRPGSGRLIS